MKRFFVAATAFLLVLSIFMKVPSAFSEDKGSKLRIGYVESEEYNYYPYQLSYTFSGLKRLGVINLDTEIDPKTSNSREIWNNICDNYHSDRIELVRKFYFNMKDMDKKDYAKFINSEDVDLVIVMGTVAGKYFADYETRNKFMVFAAADPVASGITKSETERYKDNAFAHIDKARFERQIKACYKMLNFKKIGVVYQDTPEAYVYSAIEPLKNASKELNFEIIEEHVDEAKDDQDYARYYSDLKKAYKNLARKGIDTLYITTATIQEEKLLELLEPDIYKNNIYTIAQSNERQVELGAMIGVTILDTFEQGYFGAEQIKAYLDGTPFNQLEQVNDGTPKMYINYDIAKRLGFKVNLSDLLIMDAIYKL